MIESILAAFIIASIVTIVLFLLLAFIATVSDASFNEFISGKVIINFFKTGWKVFDLNMALITFTFLSFVFFFPAFDAKRTLDLEKANKCTCRCKRCQELIESDVLDRLSMIEHKLSSLENK